MYTFVLVHCGNTTLKNAYGSRYFSGMQIGMFCELLLIEQFSSIFIVAVEGSLHTNSDAPPSVNAKSVAEVSDVIEEIFLVTLNQG